LSDEVAFGWPCETRVAMSRIVFAGLFDRWPKLKIVTHAGKAIRLLTR
jgi:predicted TIM-barrel fold metal-dependent hydrolase